MKKIEVSKQNDIKHIELRYQCSCQILLNTSTLCSALRAKPEHNMIE